MRRYRTRMRAYLLLALAALVMLLSWHIPDASAETSAQAEVNDAWRKAQEVGLYEYKTDIVQTTRPLPTLANVGLSSTEERLYIEGVTDLPAETMQMKLWSNGGSVASGQDSIEIRVEDGKALGRVGASEWEEVDDFTNLFAPGRDALAYLAGTKNMVNAGVERRAGIEFTRYTFEVDGVGFAEHMRDQMQEEMRINGQLPSAVNLGLMPHYVEMTGQGEIWLDSEGLPLRQLIDLNFPPDSQQQVSAQITTDFSNWGQVDQSFFGLPRLIQQHDWPGTAFSLAFLMGIATLMMLMVLNSESKRVYKTVAISAICAIVLGPLLQSHQVHAFSVEQAARQVEYDAERETRQAERKVQAELNEKEFDPQVGLLAQKRAEQQAQERLNQQGLLEYSEVTSARVATVDATDTDDDGLTDEQEEEIGTNPNLADSDGDSLDDGIEFYELGTNPTTPDSDGDLISDKLEVQRSSAGKYLNPLDVDTNGDGQVDTAECFDLRDIEIDANGQEKVITPTGTSCQDTDGDGDPDPFDFDDDNDGVPDSVDLASTTVVAGGRQGNEPTGLEDQTLEFQVDHLTPGEPAFVDFQIRPTNANHLWYTLNVLDWPGEDRTGQIQRVFTDTFGSSDKDANGDMRLVPMLEIEIPFDAGYGGLPVKDTAPATMPKPPTPTGNPQADFAAHQAWFDSWLDRDQMNSFGISVKLKDHDGTLLAYVPLNVVQDQTGDSPVALAARMVYRPKSNSFGGTQQVRMAWLVRALTDRCQTPVPDDFETDKEDSERYKKWCEDTDNWATAEQTVHVYYDDWYLTGMAVREDHGLKMGVAFENPDFADRDPNYEENLWALASGLEKTFLAGSEDITIDEIKRRFDKDGSVANDDAQRWSIPKDALYVKTSDANGNPFEFEDQFGIATMPMTHTKQILADYFVDNDGNAKLEAPTLLFMRQETYRLATLGMGADIIKPLAGTQENGVMTTEQLTVDLNPDHIPEEVMVGMNWAPYRYKGAGVWESYSINDYWEKIDESYRELFNDEPNSDIREGMTMVAKLFYLSLFKGASSLVKRNGEPLQLSQVPIPTDAQLKQDIKDAKQVGKYAKFVAKEVGRSIAEGIMAIDESTTKTSEKILEAIGGARDNFKKKKLDPILNLLGGLSKTGKIVAGVLIVTALVGVGVLIFSLTAVRGENAGQIVANLFTGLTLVLSVINVIDRIQGVIKKISEATNTAKTILAAIENVKHGVKATSQIASIIGLIISVGLTVGIFMYSIIASGIDVFSLAFNAALATAIAQIIVAVILFAINFIPVVGVLITAIIGLIDSIISVVCALVEEFNGQDENGQDVDIDPTVKEYVCGGISGILVKVVNFFIYDQTPIVDLQREDHLAFANFDVQPQPSITQGSPLMVQTDITGTLYSPLQQFTLDDLGLGLFYAWQFEPFYREQSTFDYQFQRVDDEGDNIKIDGPLALNQMNDQWQRGPEAGLSGVDTPLFKRWQNVNNAQNVTLGQAGINQAVQDFYLAEGYAINVQECIGVPYPIPPFLPIIPICWLRENKDTIHIDMSSQLIFDVFPATLDEFYNLDESSEEGEEGAYALSWSNNISTTFPLLMDADGDGLRSRAFGGNDPDDSVADRDGDGLSDFFEIQNGFDPSDANLDNDGLTDNEEWRYGTNPYLADSDQDGLRDDEEINGWEYVYAFDESGNPLITWVTSDPLNSNTDGDDYPDSLEKTYGFHPRLFSSGSILDITSQLDDEDGFVKPGQTIDYEVTLENNLRDRYALGLLDVEFPVAVQQETLDPEPFRLDPSQSAGTSGQVTVGDVGSQQVNLTNIAGANIVNLRAETDEQLVWLHFNENAGATRFEDDSLNGNYGSCGPNSLDLSAACPVAGELGIAGQALKFEPGRRYVLLDHPTAIRTLEEGDFTFSTWLNLDNLRSNQLVMGVRVPRNFSTSFYIDTNGRPAVHGLNINSSISLATNKWHHVTWRYERTNNQTLTVFVDGKYAGEATYADSPHHKPLFFNRLQIGRGQIGAQQSASFLGLIDELELYPRALSNEEIAAKFVKPPIFDLRGDDVNYRSFTESSAFESTGECNWLSCPTSVNSSERGKVLSFDQKQYYETRNVGLQNSSSNNFTIETWLYPQNNDGKRHYVMGNRVNSATGYPSLFVKDKKLGIELGHPACEFTTDSDVLTLQQWNHVVVTFGPATQRDASADEAVSQAETSSQQAEETAAGEVFTVYINGVQQGGTYGNCNGINSSATTAFFYVGRANRKADITFEKVKIDDSEDWGDGLELQLVKGNNNGTGIEAHLWAKGEVGKTNSETVLDVTQSINDDFGHTFSLWENDFSANEGAVGGNDDKLKEITIYNRTPSDFRIPFETSNSDNYGILNSVNKGTLHFKVYNEFFKGKLDNLKIYDYTRSAEEVADSYSSDQELLQLRFDEAPGRDIFRDDSGNGFSATCGGSGCPATGLPGRANQAIRFDGENDEVTLGDNFDIATEQEMTIAMWLKSSSRHGNPRLYSKRLTGESTKGHEAFVNASGHVVWNFNDGTRTRGIEGTSNVADGQWHHVLLAKEKNGVKLYVDGALQKQASEAHYGKDFQNNVAWRLGYADFDNVAHFDGMLDQVRIFNQALSQEHINGLLAEVPLLNLHLDEAEGATTFVNANPIQSGTCSGNACPDAGTKGQIYQAVTFDGQDDMITIPDNNAFDLDHFTIGLWVKPTQKKSRWQPLLIKETGSGKDRNYNLFIKPNTMTVRYSIDFGDHRVDKDAGELLENQWNHVMMTYNGQEVVVYINGSRAGASLASGSPKHNNDPIRLGYSNRAPYTPFAGQMDEVVIYGQALESRDVRALYDYQLAWFDTSYTHEMTVDAEVPTAVLDMNATHLSLDDRVMAIAAADTTSSVVLAEYQVNGGGWQAATPDEDAWLFTFEPTSGEGRYTIDVRATDQVGHVSATQSRTFTIDGSGPNIELESAFVGSVLGVQDNATTQTWDLQLSGTVSDPAPARNLTGSGMLALYVRLQDEAGVPVSDPQRASLSPVAANGQHTWQLSYAFDAPPNGRYTAIIEALDKDLNPSRITSDIISVDGTAPLAEITSTGPVANTITGTITLEGSANDLPEGTTFSSGVSEVEIAFRSTTPGSTFYNETLPEGSVLYLPLDESSVKSEDDPSPTDQFTDISAHGHQATCTGGSCPRAGAEGRHGGALFFDGADDYVVADAVTQQLADSPALSFGAWVYSRDLSSEPGLLTFHDEAGANLNLLHHLSDGKFYYNDDTFAGVRSQNSFALEEWHHVMVVIDEANNGTLYVNGKSEATFTTTVRPTSNGRFSLGQEWDGNRAGQFFAGSLDEVVVFNRSLSTDEVKALYVGSAPVLHLAFDERQATDQNTLTDSSDFANHGILHTNDSSSHFAVGQVGQGALHFDGVDDYVVVDSVTEQLADSPALSFGAWVYSRDLSSEPGILSFHDEAGGNLNLLHHLSDGKFFYNDETFGGVRSQNSFALEEWHYVMVVIDEANNGTLYVNGQPEASFVTTARPANNGRFSIGQEWDNDTPGQFFNGLIDDVYVTGRALLAEEIQAAYYRGWQAVTLAQAGQESTTWSHQVPAGLEGSYEIDLRTKDGKGNVSQDSSNYKQWQGFIDNTGPRLALTAEVVGEQARYTTIAQDIALSRDDFVSPCGTEPAPTEQGFQAPWYLGITGQSVTESGLYQLTASCDLESSSAEPVTACDNFGNCTTQSFEARRGAATASPLGVFFLDAPTVLQSQEPVVIAGSAYADQDLQELTVSIDGQEVYKQDSLGTSDSKWEATWTPSREGPHTLSAVVTDAAGNVISETLPYPMIVDLDAPSITISSDVLTTTQYNTALNQVTFEGLVSDKGGIDEVSVNLADGTNRTLPARVNGERWAVSWPLASSSSSSSSLESREVPDGDSYTLTAQVTDVAGATSTISKTVTLDLSPPEPITLTLSYENSAGASTVITSGVTISDVHAPELTLDWTASSDGSGLDDYVAEWSVQLTDTAEIAQSERTSTLSSGFTAAEGQKVMAQVASRDVHGNQVWQMTAPVIVDTPLTPDYISMNDGLGPYHGWMNDSCSLIGTDYRIRDHAQGLDRLDKAQTFHTTWNADALRMTWTGANWDNDGDLFVYFDTKAGGSERAYNPYTDTITNTIVLLPAHQEATTEQRAALSTRRLRQESAITQMAADYMLWVTGSDSATLMEWREDRWQAVEAPFEYDFDHNGATPYTDLYLPFDSLGIAEPTNASLSMVAFASEQDALRLWATMPANNSVNSERIVDATGNSALQQFMLTNRYEWSSLGAGICPSGSISRATRSAISELGRAPHFIPTPIQFTGADVQLALRAEPLGIGYSVLQDGLFFAIPQLFANLANWDATKAELCANNPADPACVRNEADSSQLERHRQPAGTQAQIDFNAQDGLKSVLDVTQETVTNGQTVEYTIRYRNRGTGVTTGLVADMLTWGPVRLPDGNLITDDTGEYYNLVLPMGDLQPGEEQEISFTGQIDTTFDTGNNIGWATIDVIIHDDTGSPLENQLEWLYLDHELDQTAPEYIEIQAPDGLLAIGENEISGFVLDQSSVPSITLEIEGPTGQPSTVTCQDGVPGDTIWSCPIEVASANEGDEIKVRARATDKHGQTGAWSASQSFFVDSTSPTVTLSLDSEAAVADGLINENERTLSGRLSDNRLVSGVEVCQMIDGVEECEPGEILGTPLQRTYVYEDRPETPLTLDENAVCETPGELVRTFVVSDSFTIADVDVGLNINHSYRHDVVAYLYAPSGTWAEILSDGGSSDNFDVLLNDASSLSLSKDRNNHDTSAPFYENSRRPTEALTRFNGEQAQGTWQLIVCDFFAAEDSGSYNHSQLILTSQSLPEETSSLWQYNLSLDDDNEDLAQSLKIYALDSVGNRSNEPIAINFTLDTVVPTLSQSVIPSTHSLLSPDMQMSGVVTDSNGIKTMQLSILKPNGESAAEVIRFEEQVTTNEGGATLPVPEGAHKLFLPIIASSNASSGTITQAVWQYDDTSHFSQIGTYTIWIEVEDEAGNRTQIGPFELVVTEANQVYLPIMFRD